MVYDYASSVQGRALRVSRLTAAGAIASGAKAGYASQSFMRLAFTPEYSAGDEIEEKNSAGEVCVYYQMPNVLKRVTLELAICDPNPELTEIIAGGTVLLESTDTVGYAAPTIGVDPTPNGIGLEVWSKAIVAGKPASTNPWWWWVFPYVHMEFSGERALENGMMANVFQGWGVGNALWSPGPGAVDWDFASDRAFQYARCETAAVASTTGYLAL